MRLALDIGGTKLVAGRVDAQLSVPHPMTVPTPTSDVWGACDQLLRAVADGEDVTDVGIACAGPVDLVGGAVSPINIPEWAAGFPLAANVRDIWPRARIELAMDGAAAALGEHRLGAGRGTENLLSLVVSTGIGGGLVVGGRLVAGRTGNAGHVGHIAVSAGSEPCSCGGVGCLETVASGPSSVRWARAQGWTGTDGRTLARAAQAGDPTAVAALHRAGTALGEAFASVAALLDLETVVVGGGFARAGPPLWDAIHSEVARRGRLSFLSGLRVVPAELGPSGTLAGAALLTDGPHWSSADCSNLL
ncbi:ROK family protein [Rhodococcus sp. NPDC058521]|uniref:ROK family protein n=1 Tax=Rhodococcus sp. NPDC058521 TaxID=3346536 RepID=UPI003659AB17